MKLDIFCIRDRGTDQFGNPMFLINRGQALRSFSDEINRAADDNQLYKHFDDFDLYCLGSYDTDSGLFHTSTPEMIITGKSVRT